MPHDDNSPNLATDVAMEAAREWLKLHIQPPSGRIPCIEAFMAGAAWQSAQSAKLLAGVVRERDHRGQ